MEVRGLIDVEMTTSENETCETPPKGREVVDEDVVMEEKEVQSAINLQS
jgi:hypothetical protein